MAGYILILACLAVIASSLPLETQDLTGLGHGIKAIRLPFQYYSREAWGGRPPTGGSRLDLPVPLVTIHHTYMPAACFNAEECKTAMRWIQDYHQIHQGWTDTGYNFAIGSDGSVYEGRGWSTVGAHAVGVNARSIGIVFIGDYVSDLPPHRSIQAAKDLINIGVQIGVISPSYNVIGHRQVSATECPGQSLFTEISSWPRFLPNIDVNA